MEHAVDHRRIGLAIKLLNQKFRHTFEKNAKTIGDESASLTHGRILRFLERNQHKDIFQKDIEKEFHINRSTVTSVMQVMEKNGLILRKPVPYDSRLKQVCITDKGMEINRKAKEIIDQTELQLQQTLTQQEITEFLRIARKIEQNM
jgi:DNA-binding MarR family transcriptional regulator